jgi:hypothetical protein
MLVVISHASADVCHGTFWIEPNSSVEVLHRAVLAALGVQGGDGEQT